MRASISFLFTVLGRGAEGGGVATPGTPQDYAKFLAAEQAKWGEIVNAIGFKEQN